jgi:hypothetical protein
MAVQGCPKHALGRAEPRMTGEEHYSLHHDTDAEAELRAFSTRLAEPPFEERDSFWS